MRSGEAGLMISVLVAASPDSIPTPAIRFSASSAAALETAIKAKGKGTINLMYNKHDSASARAVNQRFPSSVLQASIHHPGCRSPREAEGCSSPRAPRAARTANAWEFGSKLVNAPGNLELVIMMFVV